jgi:hypothetical protein
MQVPAERIEAILEEAESYPTDDPEALDDVVRRAREAFQAGDVKTLDGVLRELAELCRSGATSFG